MIAFSFQSCWIRFFSEVPQMWRNTGFQNIRSVCVGPPFFSPLLLIPPWWAASLPWKRSKHPKSDASVTTKYLIISISFSGRQRLHLRVSLSDLETTDWQRGPSAFWHERRRSGGVGISPHLCTVCCYFKFSVSLCLTFSISNLFRVLNKKILLGETAIHDLWEHDLSTENALSMGKKL